MRESTKVNLYTHKKPNECFEIIMTLEDEAYPPENLEAKFSEIAVTVLVPKSKYPLMAKKQNEGKVNSLTLELQQMEFKRARRGPSNHRQEVSMKLNKILLREDKNLPILQTLHKNRDWLKIEANVSKVGTGNKINQFDVILSPFELNARESIIFNVLSLIGEMR